jgi:hypothetical protein
MYGGGGSEYLSHPRHHQLSNGKTGIY